MLFFDVFDFYLLVAIFLTCFQQLAVDGYRLSLDLGGFQGGIYEFDSMTGLDENYEDGFDEELNQQNPYIWYMFALGEDGVQEDAGKVHCVATAINPRTAVTAAQCVIIRTTRAQLAFYLSKGGGQQSFLVKPKWLRGINFENNFDKIAHDVVYLQLGRRVGAPFEHFLSIGADIPIPNQNALALFEPFVVTVMAKGDGTNDYPKYVLFSEGVTSVKPASEYFGQSFHCLDQYIICLNFTDGPVAFVAGSPLVIGGELRAIASFAPSQEDLPQLFKKVAPYDKGEMEE